MAISIPAIVDAQLAALQAQLRPVTDGATNTSSRPVPPHATGNRVTEVLRMLSDLIVSGTLTGEGVHTAVDSTNAIAAAAATDQSTSNTLLTEAKGDANAHFVIVGASEHIGADVTNAIAAADATDLATSITLANELKLDINAHMLLNAATGHYGPDLTNAITAPDATDLASVIVLANDIKAKYNAHIANIKAGSARSVVDNAAFTGANSLIGATVTFAPATTTTALQGVTAVVSGNGVNNLVFSADLPAVPVVGDTFTLAWTAVDESLDLLDNGKPFGGSNPDVYGYGPTMTNVIMMMIEKLGGSMPAYLTTGSAEPFGLGSPHMGGAHQWGHGGADLMADALQVVRDTVAAYTVPA